MNNKKIVVIDYGMGNLRSVAQALRQVADGQEVLISSEPDEISRADRVVFPGQGAMLACRSELAHRGLDDVIHQALKNKPFLGICLGLQVLLEHSEEGDSAGLGVFAGTVRRFSAAHQAALPEGKLKIPHMGWNEVQQMRPHPLWENIADHSRFYFVHSFYADTPQQALIAGQTRYGLPFTSVIARDNIFALQCHPEKSASAGLRLLYNFIHWHP